MAGGGRYGTQTNARSMWKGRGPPATRDVTRAGAQLDRIRFDHVRLEEVALIEASLVNASFRSAIISLSEFDRSLATGATHC